MSDQFMELYSIVQVSEQLDVPQSTIRQWEKNLEGIFEVKRDRKGSRYYTDFEIHTLENVKRMRDKNLSFEVIREVLSQSREVASGLVTGSQETAIAALPTMTQSEAIQTIMDLKMAVEALAERVESIVQQEVRREVESVRNEIASTSELLTGHMEVLSKQLESQQQAIDTVVTETRAERHKKRGFWQRLFGE